MMLAAKGIPFLVFDNTPGENFWPTAIHPNVIRRGLNLGLGVALKALDEAAKQAGYSHMLYFDEDIVKCPDNYRNIKNAYLAKKDNAVHFVHANWMVGDETKTNALKKCGLWFV